LRTEQKWLPVLAKHLPLPTPTPVRIGEPSALFEHTWTITRWVEGEPADYAPIARADAAETLARFLKALHQQAPAEAAANPTRGIPLAGMQDEFTSALEVIADDASAYAARETWEKTVAAPPWHGAPTWLYGDPHPANVVVQEGTLAGVIDFGEMCAGDPATDLSADWILLPAGTASRFFGTYEDVDEATIARASRLGRPARPAPDQHRTQRQARSPRGQADLGTGRPSCARTRLGRELIAQPHRRMRS